MPPYLAMCVDKGKPEVSGQHALAVPKVTSGHGSETEGVDDILDAVVRTATKKSSDQQPRDRLRARNVDRKSCEFCYIADLVICLFICFVSIYDLPTVSEACQQLQW